MSPGRLVAIAIADSAGEPMRAVEFAELRAGVGIVADRYATGRGHWQEWPDHEITLMSADSVESLGISALDFRRNLVVSGLDPIGLIGKEFAIGDASLTGVRPCAPCVYLENLLGRRGVKAALEQIGGLRATIAKSGFIRVGDTVDVAQSS